MKQAVCGRVAFILEEWHKLKLIVKKVWCISIPNWLGDSFQNLVILMLSSNHFNGSLPPQLCHLVYIQILDVSVTISGGIPNCLKVYYSGLERKFKSYRRTFLYEKY
ncbi:hypothetical protein DVH24_014317 [Malus domestica]|uniref:Uncharacterized protein n=1 Tax=Malus domestica TaxID=3750 RepID=A0A498JK86_MALDO|nr:hypothetical protein DVH24_014317 [Malus domestica]